MWGHFLVVTGTRLWVLPVFSGQGLGLGCSAYFTMKICSLQFASSVLVEKCCFRPSSHLPSPPLGPGSLNLQSGVGSRGPISCLIFFFPKMFVYVRYGVCVWKFSSSSQKCPYPKDVRIPIMSGLTHFLYFFCNWDGDGLPDLFLPCSALWLLDQVVWIYNWSSRCIFKMENTFEDLFSLFGLIITA